MSPRATTRGADGREPRGGLDEGRILRRPPVRLLQRLICGAQLLGLQYRQRPPAEQLGAAHAPALGET